MAKKTHDDDGFERERLHRAAEDGNLAEVERLVNAGVPLELFDDISYTPLHYAVRAERYKVVEFLLARGADVNACDSEKAGETPLGVSAQGHYPEMAELLLAHGANPDLPGWMAITARLRARARSDEDGQRIHALIGHHRPVEVLPNPSFQRTATPPLN